MTKMLEDLAEVMAEIMPRSPGGPWAAVNFIRTHHAEIAQNAEALFQLSVRLDAPREPDMDDGSWHTDMISSAQYLANQARRLKALEQALDGAAKDKPKFVEWIRIRADELMREGTGEGVG